MSKIKDVETAKVGLSGLFGSPTPTGDTTPVDRPLTTKEEIVESLSPETREALQEEIHRRHHLKSGRPPGSKKGTDKKTPDTIPMTFRITPEKQTLLREIALRRGLLISELLWRGIDLVIEEYRREEGL